MEASQFNIRHLAAFVAICDYGSSSEAARAVHISQPAISQGISLLEQLLGQPLFVRTGSGMEPNEAALVLLPRARTALRHIASNRVTAAQLRAFRALAQAGSYASASVVTGLSQASLHRAVSDLSIAIGQRLVERRGRSLNLTSQGASLARRCGLAYAELRAGLEELALLTGREVGRITIGAMPLIRARVLPAALAEFHRLYPNIALRIVEGSHAELVGPLRDGEIDMMVGALRGLSPQDELKEEPLFVDRPVILGGAGHPLLHAKIPPTLADLGAYEWVIAPPNAPLHGLWKDMFESRGMVPPPVAVECGSVITIRQLLLEGDYLTLLSVDQLAVEIQAGLISHICDAPPQTERTIAITMRSEWRPTLRQADLMNLLKTKSLNS